MIQATLRVPARPVETTELRPILRRMDVGTAFCVPGIRTASQAINYRAIVYSLNNQYNRTRLWKTHVRPEGLFIERWR